MAHMQPSLLTIETGREKDGRWYALIPLMPGVMVYGKTREGAIRDVQALALEIAASRVKHKEEIPAILSGVFKTSE